MLDRFVFNFSLASLVSISFPSKSKTRANFNLTAFSPQKRLHPSLLTLLTSNFHPDKHTHFPPFCHPLWSIPRHIPPIPLQATSFLTRTSPIHRTLFACTQWLHPSAALPPLPTSLSRVVLGTRHDLHMGVCECTFRCIHHAACLHPPIILSSFPTSNHLPCVRHLFYRRRRYIPLFRLHRVPCPLIFHIPFRCLASYTTI